MFYNMLQEIIYLAKDRTIKLYDSCLGRISYRVQPNTNPYVNMLLFTILTYETANIYSTSNILVCLRIIQSYGVNPYFVTDIISKSLENTNSSLNIEKKYLPLIRRVLIPRIITYDAKIA